MNYALNLAQEKPLSLVMQTIEKLASLLLKAMLFGKTLTL